MIMALMSIDLRPLLALAALADLSGCVARSTASDVSAVRTLVKQRADLDLAVVQSKNPEQLDAAVSALAAQPLTLDNAVRIALLNNRDLRADLLDLGVARGQLMQASLFPNPEVEAERRTALDGDGHSHWDLGASIDLTHIILRQQRQGVAEAELDEARFRAAAATLDLAYQVRLAFYDVQAGEQQLELMTTALQAFAAGYRTAETLHRAGNLPELDLLTEQSAYEGARIAVAEAEADRIDSRERLSVLLGLFGRDTAWQIDSRLPEPPSELGDLDRLEGRAIEASVELAQMRSQLTAAARRVGLAKATGWLPDIKLGVKSEYDGSEWEVGPSISASLPFFDRQQGNVLSRQAQFDGMRARYVADAIGIRAAMRSARGRAMSALLRVRQYRDTVLPLRERVVAQTLLHYNAMQVGVFQLLQARREQIEAGRMYVATLLEYWRARATLDQLLAGRLAGTMMMTATESAVRMPSSGTERGH